jgi:hypothetical protein
LETDLVSEEDPEEIDLVSEEDPEEIGLVLEEDLEKTDLEEASIDQKSLHINQEMIFQILM